MWSVDDRTGPLAGIRVLELGAPGPAPWACMVLAGLGASVLRVERPDVPVGRYPGAVVTGRDRRRVFVDLKSDDGREHVLGLTTHADVLVEGFRPGVTERLGLGPDDCASRNPRLVYARMSGWGQTGPQSGAAGHDLNYLAATGALAAMVPEGSTPSYPLAAALTFGGGSMFLLLGIVSALYERTRSGRGQVVDAAVGDGISMLLASAYGTDDVAAAAPSPGYTTAPFYSTYRCSDGAWIAVAPMEDATWRSFCEVLGLVDDGARWDADRWDALREDIASRFTTRPRDEWLQAFAGVDAGVTPVLRMSEVPGQLQTLARGMFVTRGGVDQPTVAPRFSRSTCSVDVDDPAGNAWDAVLAGGARSPMASTEGVR